MTPLLLADAPQAVDPGAWVNLLGTIVTVALGVVTLLGIARKWCNNAIRTSDGRSLAQVVEQNSGVLTTLTSTVDRLADQVHDVRTHQSGLTERVSSIERRLDNQFPSSRWRR